MPSALLKTFVSFQGLQGKQHSHHYHHHHHFSSRCGNFTFMLFKQKACVTVYHSLVFKRFFHLVLNNSFSAGGLDKGAV